MMPKPFVAPVQPPPIAPADPTSLLLQAMPTPEILPNMEAKSPLESVLPPTQYAPPLTHTQHASALSSPSADLHARRTPSQDKVRIWSIGRRQIVAILIGTLIFGILNYAQDELLVAALAAKDASVFSIGGLAFLPSFWNLAFGILLAVPVFFGAEFGPWAGLVIMLAGSLPGDYASGLIRQPLGLWYLYPCLAILGFIPGLALLRTMGQYNTRGAFITAIIFIDTAIVVSGIFMAIGDSVVNQLNFFSSLSYEILSNVPVLILAPILLISYQRVFKRRKYVS
jgi:hypothetical protein